MRNEMGRQRRACGVGCIEGDRANRAVICMSGQLMAWQSKAFSVERRRWLTCDGSQRAPHNATVANSDNVYHTNVATMAHASATT